MAIIDKRFGLGRNYSADRPIGELMREHRRWASPQMARIDRIEVRDVSLDTAGFVTIWAMGEPRPEDVGAYDEIFGLVFG